MKIAVTTSPVQKNWNGHKHKLQHLFTWLTGYEIVFEGSRKDMGSVIYNK